jgi:hypothetical protein
VGARNIRTAIYPSSTSLLILCMVASKHSTHSLPLKSVSLFYTSSFFQYLTPLIYFYWSKLAFKQESLGNKNQRKQNMIEAGRQGHCPSWGTYLHIQKPRNSLFSKFLTPKANRTKCFSLPLSLRQK